MNTVDREAEVTHDREFPYSAIASYRPIELPSVQALDTPRQPRMTIEQIYILSFRIVCGGCLGFLLFVAAIYYQVINP